MSAALRARLHAEVGSIVLDVRIETTATTLVVVGPNGAGKSSLLRALLGALPVRQGRVEVDQRVLLDTASGIDVPIEERNLGYVPQDYALFPHFTVAQNIEFALSCSPARPSPARIVERRDAMLAELSLVDLAERRPASLSGGEKQRVALARALSARPRALLLDEPLAALDVHARREVRCFLADYLAKLQLPSLVVTHDAKDARELGARVAVLEQGQIIQTGTWQELVAAPASPFVAELTTSVQTDE